MTFVFRLDPFHPFHPFHLGFVAKPNAPGRSDAEFDVRRFTCEACEVHVKTCVFVEPVFMFFVANGFVGFVYPTLS